MAREKRKGRKDKGVICCIEFNAVMLRRVQYSDVA